MEAQARLGLIALIRENKQFRRLWYAQVVSEVGDWFQLVALLTLLPTSGGRSHVVAGYLFLRLVPSIVLAPLAGVIADRLHRGRVVVACDLLRAVTVLLYVFVIRRDGSINVPLLYGLTFLQEGLSAFFEPARGALVPQIVPTRGLLSANILSGATWSAMLSIGAFLGGIATRTLGRNAAYAIDAASFVASALFALAARLPPLPAPSDDAPRSGEPRIGALREGFRYLRTHRAQAISASLKGGWGLVGGISVLFAAFADQVFSHDDEKVAAAALGLLYAGRGFGALVGPFVARRISGETIAGLTRAILFSFPVAAVGYFAFAGAPSVAFAAGALVVAHCGGSTIWVHSTQLLQLSVPNRLLGRVVAVEYAILTAAMCASTLGVAFFLDVVRLTPRVTAVVLATIPLLVALAWSFARRGVRARLEQSARELSNES